MNYKVFFLTITFALLNIVSATVVSFLKLPLYLDSVGTILGTYLLGLKYGIAIAILTNTTLTFIASPTYFSYIGTAVIIAVIVHFLRRINYLKALIPTIIGGVIIGIVAAIVSAPVTAYLYGGVSLSGTDAFIVFFKQIGYNILQSVILGGLATDPVDKVVSSLIAYYILKNLPNNFLSKPS